MISVKDINLKYYDKTKGSHLLQYNKKGQVRLVDQKFNRLYEFFSRHFEKCPNLCVSKSQSSFSLYIEYKGTTKGDNRVSYAIRFSDHKAKKLERVEFFKGGRTRFLKEFIITDRTFVEFYPLYLEVCRTFKDYITEKEVRNNQIVQDKFYFNKFMRDLQNQNQKRSIKEMKRILFQGLKEESYDSN